MKTQLDYPSVIPASPVYNIMLLVISIHETWPKSFLKIGQGGVRMVVLHFYLFCYYTAFR